MGEPSPARFRADVDRTLYLRQQEMLSDAKPGLNERDVLVISVLQDIVSTKERLAAPVSADDLRDAYDVLPHGFHVVLIGRDGGVKLRQKEPILAADLFALIDSMPMRKQEMGRRPGEFVIEQGRAHALRHSSSYLY